MQTGDRSPAAARDGSPARGRQSSLPGSAREPSLTWHCRYAGSSA